MSEVKALVDLLNYYRNSYYNNNKSLISDKEYDELFDKLVKLEEETGIVYANSPTITVGYEVLSQLNKVKHNHPLLSLNKTTDINEFSNYFRGKPYIIMAKLDGLTCSIIYKDGEMVRAESRGNGEVGEDITHNARTFINLPKNIPFKQELIVDGECIITYNEFRRINQRENTEYKNPRNLVSGSVRQLNSEIAAKRNIRFVAWKLHSAEGEDIKTNREAFAFLNSLGFDTVPFGFIDSKEKDADTYIEAVKEACEDCSYPIDGMVGMYNDIAYSNSLGSTGHHPKHSIAYKFYQERNETILREIEWNTSRSGLVNPVAIFDPIEIDGTTVTRASLSNVSIIKELELGIGDTITVIKANQIIPQVTDNLTRSNTYQIPMVCPSCSGELVAENANGRVMLYCKNKNCPAINHDKIANFASREGMNIVGISEERLKILMDHHYITDFASIYNLKNYRNEIIKIEGFGVQSTDNLIAAIEESKECKFANFLVAIGIPGIGKSMAKTISKYCVSIKDDRNIINQFIDMAVSGFDWSILDDIGENISSSINVYVSDNLSEIKPLAYILAIIEENADVLSENIFGSKTFCITGKLFKYPNRDKLVEDIDKYGGKVVSSVTSKTDYLITNEPNSGSSKNQKAAKFGTKIITEDQFIEMCKK